MSDLKVKSVKSSVKEFGNFKKLLSVFVTLATSPNWVL
ncbi:MAG: hypothetical protein CM15mP93_16820 [Thiotrichaceae bacterium]|nr:MAG: hypothetical protein CM15mP93_16820 [Thiotrichaceae bacterium]